MVQNAKRKKGGKKVEGRKEKQEDFAGGLMVKNPSVNAGATGSIPHLGIRFYVLQVRFCML